MMNTQDKIYIAGHSGLVGTSLLTRLRENGYVNIVVKTHSELDLTRQSAAEDFFERERPDFVFLCAARVGGIHANSAYPAEFIYDNLAIELNVIHSAWRFGVRKLLLFGSACSYPRECAQPMKEEYLLSGPLEPTNEPYAVAKISGIKMCQAYNAQYGTNFICAVPTNVYGPRDNFDPKDSHVIPALLRRFHEAREKGEKSVQIWGTGNPLREFLYVDDLADAALFLMDPCQGQDVVNIGSGCEVSIRDLVLLIKDIIGFQGEVVFDTSKPDGMPRKLLDTSKLSAMGWSAKTPLRDGLEKTFSWFLDATR